MLKGWKTLTYTVGREFSLWSFCHLSPFAGRFPGDHVGFVKHGRNL